MAVKFNPFSGQLQIDEKGAGGGSSYIDGEVAAYGDLSLDAGVAPLNSAWLVREASGTWLLGRKPAGIYIRTATAGSSRDADYTYAGILPDVFSDANFTLYDDGDSTKNAKFQLSGITTATTRTITVPDANITLDDSGDTRDPNAHAASHASAGSDPLTPAAIGAMYALETRTNDFYSTSTYALAQGRNVQLNSSVFSIDAVATITLPRLTTDSAQNGDDLVVVVGAVASGSSVVIERYIWTGSGYISSKENVVTTTVAGSWRFRLLSGVWTLLPVMTHTHAASAITSGTLTHERGGLEADVSAYNGLVKIASGSTSAVTVTSAGEALLDDADAAAQRTTLGLGTAAVEAASAFAQASHSHELTALAATGATNGHVLTANGSNGVTFAALPASGVTGAASSASDVLGVSGANITGVDANADRIVYWNNTSNKLAYGTPADAGAAAASHTHAASDITSGTIDTARLASGTANSGTFLRGDQTWAAVSGVTTGSVDNAVLRADGTGGSTSQSSDISIEDATTSTENNVTISNQHSGQTNSSLVLSPKGTGAFIVGPRPTGASTTGNARGARAIDISLNKNSSTRVASGADSVLIGNDGTASQSQSVSIGFSCQNTGSQSVAIGRANNASGTRCISIGNFEGSGTEVTASGDRSIAMGRSVSGVNAVGLGDGATLRAEFATLPFHAVYWSGQTTNNTATILNLDGTATNRFTIAANTALAVDILLVARRSDVADKWLVARRFLGIRRDGSNNTSLIGAVQTLGTDQSEGSPSWSFTLTADDTNEALQLEVTGATSETVQWRATAMYRVV